MKEIPTFIQLEGVLYENLEFEYRRGYETRTAQRCSNETNTLDVTALLADDNDKQLVSISPDVKFPMGCVAGMPAVGLYDLRVSLPMHPDARSIQLRAKNRLLFRRKIGKTIPSQVGLETKQNGAGDSISVKLDGVSDDDIEQLMFLETEDKRRYPIPADLKEDSMMINLRPYAGLGKAKLVVRHSSAFRSIESSSVAFELPKRSTCGRILEPRENAVLASGAPFSMLGSLCDENGRLIEWDLATTFWCVDGKRMDDARQIALCTPLDAGEHKIELLVANNGEEPTVLHQISIRVKERTKEQREYDAIVERYLLSKKTKQRLPDAAK